MQNNYKSWKYCFSYIFLYYIFWLKIQTYLKKNLFHKIKSNNFFCYAFVIISFFKLSIFEVSHETNCSPNPLRTAQKHKGKIAQNNKRKQTKASMLVYYSDPLLSKKLKEVGTGTKLITHAQYVQLYKNMENRQLSFLLTFSLY